VGVVGIEGMVEVVGLLQMVVVAAAEGDGRWR